MLQAVMCFLIGLALQPRSNVVHYEGTVFPEVDGWERVQFLECERLVSDGWLTQECELGGAPGPIGETDFYRRALGEYEGESAFFIEWRVRTDVPSELFDESGIASVLSASGISGVNYHFTITRDLVRLIRDNLLPIVLVEVSAGKPHVYRLELATNMQYCWYIDGEKVDEGAPEGSYPSSGSFLIWGARHNVYENVSSWDYIRFGVTPEDASGDFDSDGTITLFDAYFFHECASNGGPDTRAGPGCRFADFDGDSDVDLLDLANMQNQFATP